jgi:hypothetical protein
LFADEVDFFGVVADLVLGQGMVEMLDGATPGTRLAAATFSLCLTYRPF